MKAKRFSEEQIIAVLKEAETGAKTNELCAHSEVHRPHCACRTNSSAPARTVFHCCFGLVSSSIACTRFHQ